MTAAEPVTGSQEGQPAELDVFVPTYRRPAALAVTLAGLAAQTLPRFRVVVSDQSEDGAVLAGGEVQTCVRLLRARGRPVELHRHLPRRGLAEHRDFLLGRATAPYALFLDDDVLCEPPVLARLLRVIREQACGFVGAPLIGLSHLDDVRPGQQGIEPWDGSVRPEPFGPDDPRWQRYHLHSAANVWHVQQRLGVSDADSLLYKVAWVGGCVLYDVAKLRSVGGFGFWQDLPAEHCGEDVLAQSRVRARYGGCGVLPSGAYHQQLPTTVENRLVDAPYHLPVHLGDAGGQVDGHAQAERRAHLDVRGHRAEDGSGYEHGHEREHEQRDEDEHGHEQRDEVRDADPMGVTR